MRLGIGLYSSPTGALLVDLAARARRVRFSTNERGFAGFSCFLPCTLVEAFRLYELPVAHVAVTFGGLVIWEGRLEDKHIVPGGIELRAFGYIRGYADAPYSASHILVTAQPIVQALVAAASALNSVMSSSTMLIQDPGVSLAETYEDRYPIEILDRLCSLGDDQDPPRLWEFCVWEGRLPAYRPRGDAARKWFIDVAEPDFESTLDTLYNSVYAVYQGGGNARAVTATETDALSVARYGLTRRQAVSLQTQDAALAATVRDAHLDDHATPPPRGVIRFRELYDQYGTRWPAYFARSSDQVTYRNLPPTLSPDIDRIRTFRLKETDYDADADLMQAVPEALFAGISAQSAFEQGRGASLTDLNAQYQARPQLAELYADFKGLAGLRGLWYPGAINNTGLMPDASGNGRDLAYNGNPTLNIHNSFIPYWDCDGTGDFHSRADEAALDLTGTEGSIVTALRGITMGGWFWFDTLPAASGLIGKGASAGSQLGYRSYLLGSNPTFEISADGVVANRKLFTTALAVTTGRWHFLVFRFDPSTEMKVWLNESTEVNTTSIPASAFANNAALLVGATDAGSNPLDGRHAVTFLCGALLSDAQVAHLFTRTRKFFQV